MQTIQSNPNSGGGLVVVMCTIALFSLLLGGFFVGLIPKYRSAHLGANWHEAHKAAEAGINYGLQTLNRFAVGGAHPDSYGWSADWAGNVWTYSTSNGPRTLQAASLPVLGGRTNAKVSGLSIDVYTRHPASQTPWFRIRSSGRADVASRYVPADRRDVELRRMRLRGTSGGASDPHVTRTIEVIARPKSRFSRAITTVESLSLGNSANWLVDSFDSTDTAKSDPGTSAGGVYPSSAAERQANGGIATLKTLPTGVEYGALIQGNGAVVKGDVETNGGDDPATPNRENVAGSSGMDQDRIYSSFDDDLPPVSKPVWNSGVSSNPPGNTNFTTNAAGSTPKRYVIDGNLGAFTVVAPASGTGYVEIVVSGNLNLGNGKIVIPPNVYATVYVDGNVNFGNGDVNTGTGSSKVASHFVVYGVSTAGNPTYSASGNAEQTLVFYGPRYAGQFNGTVDTYGSVVLKSFSINGGGNGGFHYDEALNNVGPVGSWEVASYFDDARAEIQ